MPTSDVYFAWNANSESDIAGYKIWAGRSTGGYSHSASPKDMGNVLTGFYTVDDNGQWFFALTAYNTAGTPSDFSTEIFNSFVVVNPPIAVRSFMAG